VSAGVFGAWIALRLGEAGQRVALVDAYEPGNARSSSGGQTRVLRMGYGDQEIKPENRARAARPATLTDEERATIRAPAASGRGQ
jgi:glycine/D-amino acid oxidase-like deaminating enzyme